MKPLGLLALSIIAGLAAVAAQPPAPPLFTWSTVVNNTDLMPGTPAPGRAFNSYNQPSVNVNGVVVIRARSRGGLPLGEPTHGIYVRDMGVAGSPILRILDRTTEVPQPNNAHYPPDNPLLTTFVETPSFPRIDMGSDTVATRGNHQPVWVYALPDGSETRVGTTGIYTNPFGPLIAGAAKLGAVPGLEFFAVPGLEPPVLFDVFPGAPAVTGGSTIVFKGNYTLDDVGRTGVYYRVLAPQPIVLPDGTELAPAGGDSPVVLIANNTDTLIPGTGTVFGSTSPPSAANGLMVFAGFDDEWNPTLGGLYRAPLAPRPPLTTLVGIGERVPGESVADVFNGLGEGAAFDGRYVGFWGAWGPETRTVRLYCPTEGNKDRIAYCNQKLVCADTGETLGDPDSVCDDVSDPNFGIRCYQDKQVPVHQGIFVHDTLDGSTRTVAKTGARFDELLFWSYSGKTPCVGAGHTEEGAEDDGEMVRWRSSSFVAVSGLYTAFKAVSGEVVGIYLGKQPGQDVVTVLDTGMDGQAVDPEAPPGSTVTELGIEREGLRGDWLAVSAKMGIEGGTEEEGMAGIYLTRLPRQ